MKVLDFGVAKAHDENDTSITQTDNVVGSPAYMAPEQLRSAVFADQRSDIWSLGVILVELVGGKKPFDGISTVDLALKIATEPPLLPDKFPPALAAVVQRCLRKEPGERYQHVTELAAALEPIARGIPMPVVPPPPFAVPPQTLEIVVPTQVVPHVGEHTTLGSASGMITAHRSRARTIVVLGAALLAVAIGVGAAQLAKTSDEPAQPAAPPPVVMHVEAPPPVPAPVPVPVPVPVPDAAVAPPSNDAPKPTPAPAIVKKSPSPPPVHHHVKTKEELGESRE